MDEDLRKAIESSAAETRRHFDTIAARLEWKLETIAEGVLSMNERLERFQTPAHAHDPHR